MSAREARVIDLEEYRRKRQARSTEPTPDTGDGLVRSARLVLGPSLDALTLIEELG